MSASAGATWDGDCKKVLKADGNPVKEQNGLPLVEKGTRKRLADTHRDVARHRQLIQNIIQMLSDAKVNPAVFAICFIDSIGQGLAEAETRQAANRVNEQQAIIEQQQAEIARLLALTRQANAAQADASETDDASEHPLDAPAPAPVAPAPAPKGKGRPKNK